MSSYPPTGQTTVKRLPKRGVYDKARIHSILDEGFVCHVGFVAGNRPYVIPTGYARAGEQIYIHGSAASRMLRTLADPVDVCITVTLVDGLVLARSAFHHSMNYRSVVILGQARTVTDPTEKVAALRAFTDHVVPGRWDEVRVPTEQEVRGTTVLAVSLREVSAKVRTGPPIDDEEDYGLPVWAGVVPVRLSPGLPIPDARVSSDAEPFDVGRLLRRTPAEFTSDEQPIPQSDSEVF